MKNALLTFVQGADFAESVDADIFLTTLSKFKTFDKICFVKDLTESQKEIFKKYFTQVIEVQNQLLQQQREFQDLGIKLFDWGRISKVTLPAKAKRLQTEITELTKLAKTDRNPKLRQDKIKRLKVQLSEVQRDIGILTKEINNARATRKILDSANKALIKKLRDLGF